MSLLQVGCQMISKINFILFIFNVVMAGLNGNIHSVLGWFVCVVMSIQIMGLSND